jgi:hypothetical protein
MSSILVAVRPRNCLRKEKPALSLLAFLSSVLILAFCALPAPAQTSSTGAIVGTVMDPTRGVVPGVQIKMTNEATGESRLAETDSDGRFTISLLPPSSYRMEFSKADFKQSVQTGVLINITETTTLNISLELGEVRERMVVSAEPELLQTESTALGRVVDETLVANLPLVTRNFTQIVTLSPGIAADVTNASAVGRGSGGENGGGFRANGAQGLDNNFQMNGTEVNDFQGSTFFSGGVPIPNPDAIQEFKVQTGQYDASYGRNAGANVDIVTKAGTSSYHGDVFEFIRNDVLNANDFFRNEAGQSRGELKQNQFGFTLGGPIRKDKLLFFTSYQGTRQVDGVDPNVSQSDIFEPPFTNDRSAQAIGEMFAGRCGAIDSSCVLPIAADGSNISPQALDLLNMKLPNGQFLIPTPQTVNPTAPLETQGFSSFSIPADFNEDQFIVNMDFLQSDRSRFAARFFFANSTETQPLPNGFLDLGGPIVPGSPSTVNGNYRDFSLTHTYVFNTRLLNQAEFAFHRVLAGANTSSPFQCTDIGSTVPPSDNANANVVIFGSLSLGGAIGSGYTQNHYTFQDGLTYVHGRQTFRVGAGVTRTQDDQDFFHLVSGIGLFSWEDFLLGRAAGPVSSGGSGTPPFGNIGVNLDLLGLLPREWRVWDGNAYIQDDIKLTPNLTLNVGLRYDLIGSLNDALGRNSSWDLSAIDPNPPTSGSLDGLVVAHNFSGTIPAGVIRSANDSAIQGNGRNNFGPRLGLAWRLPHMHRMALRGGYGIYYSRPAGQTLFQQYTNQPYTAFRIGSGPSSGTNSFGNPFGPTLTFPNFQAYSPDTLLGLQANAQNLRPPITQQYSLNIQTDLGHNMLLEVGYVGTRGTHQLFAQDVNQAVLASPSNPIRGQTTNTVDNIQDRVPYEGFNTGFFNIIESESSSWYNALQTSLTKRFSKGLQFLVSYTFSRAYSTAPQDTSAFAASQQAGNQDSSQANYGLSDFNRAHRLVISYLYEFPSPKWNHRFVRQVLSGWAIAGVTTIQSGLPLTLTGNNANNVFGVSTDRAQLAPGCTNGMLVNSGAVTSKLTNYFNLNCIDRADLTQPLSATNPAIWPVIGDDGIATGFGNSGSGIVFGPGQRNFDISIIRRAHVKFLGEHGNIEFRSEFFNAFNTPQFAPPDTSVTDSTFGYITSTSVNPRIIQLSLKLYF